MVIGRQNLIKALKDAGLSHLAKFVSFETYEIETVKYLTKGERAVLKQEGCLYVRNDNGWIIFHPVVKVA